MQTYTLFFIFVALALAVDIPSCAAHETKEGKFFFPKYSKMY